jgi:uncharacterized phage-associated protein
MRFPFRDRKTAQAAAYLLRLHGGSLPYMVLIKLLYLADREMLLAHGVPITGDRMLSMKHGPVLSRVLDLLTDGPGQAPSAWFEYIGAPSGYVVELKQAGQTPPTDELSRYELSLLEKIHASYGNMNKWDLLTLLHNTLPEWRDPGNSVSGIEPADILRAGDWSDEAIHEAGQTAAELCFFDVIAAP